MMKRVFSILLIFAFLFSTVGITVAKSYCKMKKAEIEKKQCCKKKCKSNCCGKTTKVFKMSFDSLPSSFSKTIKIFITNFVSAFTQTFFSLVNTETKISFLFKPPPITQSLDFSFTGVFRI